MLSRVQWIQHVDYNTREKGVAIKTQDTGFIDMPPSDPDTVLTALHEAKHLTNERGQKNTICNQQL